LIIGDEAPLRDGQESVMGLMILSRGKIRLVGRHDRNAPPISEIEKVGLI